MLDPNKLYSFTEAAPYLGVKRSSAYRAIRQGKLRAVKIGRVTRLLGKDIVAFQEALTRALR